MNSCSGNSCARSRGAARVAADACVRALTSCAGHNSPQAIRSCSLFTEGLSRSLTQPSDLVPTHDARNSRYQRRTNSLGRDQGAAYDCVGYFRRLLLAIPVASWRGEHGVVAWLAAIVAGEVIVLMLNNMRCPLTRIAARYTDDRRDNFDIYLPEWLARHNKLIFGTLYFAGLVFCPRAVDSLGRLADCCGF